MAVLNNRKATIERCMARLTYYDLSTNFIGALDVYTYHNTSHCHRVTIFAHRHAIRSNIIKYICYIFWIRCPEKSESPRIVGFYASLSINTPPHCRRRAYHCVRVRTIIVITHELRKTGGDGGLTEGNNIANRGARSVGGTKIK